MKITNSDTVC